MAERLTYEYVKNYIEIESSSGCKLLSKEYVNNSTKMLLRCICGNKFETHLNAFKSSNKRQCNECGNKEKNQNKRLSYENIKHYIEIESGSGCKLLSEEYVGSGIKLLIQCKCGCKFKASWSKFKNSSKRQCNNCGNKLIASKKAKTSEQFEHEVYELVADEYIFLEEYKGALIKIRCRHNKCNHEWYVKPNVFLNGSRCPECSKERADKKMTKTNQEFIKDVYYLVSNEYTFLEKYINSKTKIKCKHNECGYEWDVAPNNFIRGTRCPQCVESKGEQIIRVHLQNSNIKFQQEYIFDNLIGIGGGLLRFDFYLPDYNLLIEYDGEQHYEPRNFGGISNEEALENFNQTKQNDQIKNQYCEYNNIPLLRIPYWEFDNIEQILEEWLEKYGVLHKSKIDNLQMA